MYSSRRTTARSLPEKSTRQVEAKVLSECGLLSGIGGYKLTGYEIHMGQTRRGGDTAAFKITGTPQGMADYEDGAINAEGIVVGTYLHGLFHNTGFRQGLLARLRCYWGLPEKTGGTLVDKEQQYDRLAALVRQNMDMAAVYGIMERVLV